MGAERGNVRDPEVPPTYPGRHYALRSRIRHYGCKRRMCGIRRPSGNGTAEYVYYLCPYKASNPRHVAACPDHSITMVSVREDTLIAGITAFLDQYVFGYDRAAMLKDRIPVTTAEHAAARAREHARLTAELDRITTAQDGLLTELEQLGGDKSPATQAYRERIRARNNDYHDQRTTTQAQLDALNAAAAPRDDPGLLDELPYLSATLASAPVPLIEDLLTALDLQVLYRPEQGQATIWATLTDTTPQTVNALLNDPRASLATPGPQPPAGPVADLTQDPPVHPIRRARRMQQLRTRWVEGRYEISRPPLIPAGAKINPAGRRFGYPPGPFFRGSVYGVRPTGVQAQGVRSGWREELWRSSIRNRPAKRRPGRPRRRSTCARPMGPGRPSCMPSPVSP
jgi:hypothetical protein